MSYRYEISRVTKTHFHFNDPVNVAQRMGIHASAISYKNTLTHTHTQ